MKCKKSDAKCIQNAFDSHSKCTRIAKKSCLALLVDFSKAYGQLLIRMCGRRLQPNTAYKNLS